MTISVFLADDHTIVRDGLRYLLEAHGGIKVVGEAGNGRDAVRAVKKLRPDVVVMDILMADLNGIEATDRICQECPATRVVILSMQSSSESILRALRRGRGVTCSRSRRVASSSRPFMPFTRDIAT